MENQTNVEKTDNQNELNKLIVYEDEMFDLDIEAVAVRLAAPIIDLVKDHFAKARNKGSG